MQKQFIRGGTKILKDEQGNILILGVFLILFISILFVGMVEFGRVMLVREQLQTAADSAALAGAGSGTHRFVKINVVTDRGLYQPNGPEDEPPPPCRECGIVRIRSIVGNEADLIDNGGWRDFTVPACDCGGGDTWFELVDRQLMYDTHSMGWGADPSEINNIEKDLTAATKEFLASYLYKYTSEVTRMLRDKSLKEIQKLLSDREKFISSWMNLKSYRTSCGYGIDKEKEEDCRAWKHRGYEQFRLASKHKDTVDSIVNSITNIRSTNNRPIAKIDSQYAEAAVSFFNANSPDNAIDSGIIKIKVYGYESRKSPYYPSVVVYAQSKIKTLFPQWFNGDFRTTVCAQGTTAYRDANDQISSGDNKFDSALNYGKWRKVPDEACWVDL